jgi:hypothetical protein
MKEKSIKIKDGHKERTDIEVPCACELLRVMVSSIWRDRVPLLRGAARWQVLLNFLPIAFE